MKRYTIDNDATWADIELYAVDPNNRVRFITESLAGVQHRWIVVDDALGGNLNAIPLFESTFEGRVTSVDFPGNTVL
jgi:hypothetical protein